MFEHLNVELTEMESVTGEGGRFYTTPTGIDYPSITTVLSVLSKDSIEKWKARVGVEEANKISYRASERGTAVHSITENYINNDPDYAKGFMPNVVESFLAMKPVLDKGLGKVYAQEVPLYSDHLGVAGRVDCIAEWDGVLSVIDFKTSRKSKMKNWIHQYFMQESAYAIMWEERTQIPITQLVTIISVDGRTSPQIFIEHRDNWVRPLRETIEKYKEQNTSTSLFV